MVNQRKALLTKKSFKYLRWKSNLAYFIIKQIKVVKELFFDNYRQDIYFSLVLGGFQENQKAVQFIFGTTELN